MDAFGYLLARNKHIMKLWWFSLPKPGKLVFGVFLFAVANAATGTTYNQLSGVGVRHNQINYNCDRNAMYKN